MFRASTLLRLSARLVVLLPFAALLYDPSPGLAEPFPLNTAQSSAARGAPAVTSTGATTITGDLGISPGLAAAVTGFPPGIVSGKKFAGAAVPDPVVAHAQRDLATAFTGLAGPTSFTTLSGDLDGLTLTPGVYHSDTSARLTGALTLDARHGQDAAFVVQTGTTLMTGTDSSVQMINGFPDAGVFSQVGGLEDGRIVAISGPNGGGVSVPEPSTILLFATGLVGVAARKGWKR